MRRLDDEPLFRRGLAALTGERRRGEGDGSLPVEAAPPPSVDRRQARRDQVHRLRALGVRFTELADGRSRKMLERFAVEFVDPDRTALLLEQASRAGATLDLDRWTRPDCTRSALGRGCLSWLTEGRAGARCVRFERSLHLPALEILVDTMDEAWAASWPGTFVDFEARRALMITVDYEAIQCGLRVGRAAYR